MHQGGAGPHTRRVNSDFDQYVAEYRDALRKLDEGLQRNPAFRAIEKTALSLGFLYDTNDLGIEGTDDEKLVVNVLIAKTAIECFALVGSMKNGSLAGAIHHSRSLMEIRAALNYLYEDPAKTPVRVARFLEWSKVAGYLRLARMRAARKAALERVEGRKKDGLITQDEFDAQKNEIDEIYADEEESLKTVGADSLTSAEIDEWKKLYGADFEKKPEKLAAWHAGKGITQLVAELGPHEESLYDVACNATHVSPLGHRLSAPQPVHFGWASDGAALARALGLGATSLAQLVFLLDSRCGGTLAEKIGLDDATKAALQATRSMEEIEGLK